MSPLQVSSIRVRAGKMDLEVRVALESLHVSEQSAARVLALLPGLERQLCVNGAGETFGDELVGTELAHLLEHIAIELQGRAYSERGRAVFRGHTSWADELASTRPGGFALMRVTITFEDDLVALQAVKDACSIVCWAAGSSGDEPDVAAMVERLRACAAAGA